MNEFLKYLTVQHPEQLREELKELYASFENVRHYYQIKFKGKALNQKLLEQYKSKITAAIYPNDSMEGGLDIDKVDSVVSQFNSDSTIKYYVELCLYAVEACTNIAHEYGGDFGEDFYMYFEDLFENIVKIIVRKRLTEEYKIHLKEIANTAFDGYGHYDQLQHVVSEYL